MPRWLNLTLFGIAGVCAVACGLFLSGAADGLPGLRPQPPWKPAAVAALVGADALVAAVLGLLVRRCRERPVPGGLGRELYLYRPRNFVLLGMTILGTVAAAGLLPFLLDSGGQPLTTLIITLVVTALGVGIGGATVVEGCVAVRCCETGLMHRTLLADRVLPYKELESFSFNVAQVFVNALDTGVHYGLTFASRNSAAAPDSAEVPVAFGVQVQTALGRETGAAQALEAVRDRVTDILAPVLAERLRRGAMVPWGDGLALTPQGVEYAPAGPKGRPGRGRAVLRYERVGECTVEAGMFQLREAGKPAPLAAVSAGTANFYPGLRVLRALTAAD